MPTARQIARIYKSTPSVATASTHRLDLYDDGPRTASDSERRPERKSFDQILLNLSSKKVPIGG